MTHLSWTPISNHVRSGSSQQTKKWRWGLTFHMAFSEMNNLMVERVWRERCVALVKKKKIQLHIKCAQAFHGLSNLGVICDAWKTCCLISWVMCAHVYVCACMCKRSGRGTHTHMRWQSSLISFGFLPCGGSVRHLNLHHAVRRNKHSTVEK